MPNEFIRNKQSKKLIIYQTTLKIKARKEATCRRPTPVHRRTLHIDENKQRSPTPEPLGKG